MRGHKDRGRLFCRGRVERKTLRVRLFFFRADKSFFRFLRVKSLRRGARSPVLPVQKNFFQRGRKPISVYYSRVSGAKPQARRADRVGIIIYRLYNVCLFN